MTEHSASLFFALQDSGSSSLPHSSSMSKNISAVSHKKDVQAVPAAEHSPGLDFLFLLHQGKRKERKKIL